MNLTKAKKDRYTKTFAVMTGSAMLYLYFLRQDNGNLAFTSLVPAILGLGYMGYLATQSARFHLSKYKAEKLDLKYKYEGDCGFKESYNQNIDGLKVEESRYKFVNGTDVCWNKDKNQPAPCGIGSTVMQFIGGGGKEPESIQNNKCWK